MACMFFTFILHFLFLGFILSISWFLSENKANFIRLQLVEEKKLIRQPDLDNSISYYSIVLLACV